ncbi:MAG: MFS transporter, partial [Candidatus Thorarchaeota archaeon]
IQVDSPMAFWANSIIMIGCLAILLFSVREKKDIEIEKTTREKVGLISVAKDLIKNKNLPLVLMLVSVFFHTAGYNVAETFISRYVTEVLAFGEETAGYILAAFVGFSIIAALPAGLVGRAIGALNACLVGVIGFTIALIPLTIISLLPDLTIMKNIITLNSFSPTLFTWQLPFYLLLIILLGFSWLLLSINSIVVIWNLSPKNKTATYTSYFYVFLHLASIISPFLAGGIFDLYKYIAKTMGIETSGLRVLFVYIFVFFLITVALLALVKIYRTKQLVEIKDKEEYLQQRIDQKEYPLLYIPMLLFGVGVRQERALIELREKHIKERKELKQKIRKLKKNKRLLKRRLFSEVDDLVDFQIEELKEHMKQQKELRKDYKDKMRDLKQEIREERLKKRLEESFDDLTEDKNKKNQ